MAFGVGGSGSAQVRDMADGARRTALQPWRLSSRRLPRRGPCERRPRRGAGVDHVGGRVAPAPSSAAPPARWRSGRAPTLFLPVAAPAPHFCRRPAKRAGSNSFTAHLATHAAAEEDGVEAGGLDVSHDVTRP
uniref:Uncharacterized protein n=1 Tax=Oryza meridionalis TaxID=40149 RepID=A0A0E0E0E8_9ORYZ